MECIRTLEGLEAELGTTMLDIINFIDNRRSDGFDDERVARCLKDFINQRRREPNERVW